MSIKLVYRNDIPAGLIIPEEVLPESGTPFPHHFKSTPQDNLIELAGRVCYDSCKSEKTRSSVDYHQHINDVNHGSVQEQCNLVFDIFINKNHRMFKNCTLHPTLSLLDAYRMFLNRPGVHVSNRKPDTLTLTINVRAIKEWWPISLDNDLCCSDDLVWMGQALQAAAQNICPLALSGPFDIIRLPESVRDWENMYEVEPSQPDRKNPNQLWLSFYISNVSRGLSHEWVRHKYQAAISQRSTRYVDESESDWIWHPLMQQFCKNVYTHYEDSSDPLLYNDIKQLSSDAYSNYVKQIELSLTQNNVDKFTARKQARGAARGILGNALSTEMIWSGSLAQIIRIIKQRATEAADAEIRLLANELYEIVQPIYPEYFVGTTKKPCSDGIGYSVIWP